MSLPTFPSETIVRKDPTTGVEIKQLTDYLGHSNHLYFTNPGWWDSDRRMLFGSDRDNKADLYSIELATGAITQITDFDPDVRGNRIVPSVQIACVNPKKDEAYIWYGRDLVAVDLWTGRTRVLWQVPEGFDQNIINVTADGKYVCGSIGEDLSARFDIDLGHGYVGFREIFEAKPLNRVFRTDVETGTTETIHEENAWITHVNTSPTLPHILSFCHEGPWELVQQRMWILDHAEGKVWKLREQTPDEAIGHEYWMDDGETIGYHGRTSTQKLYGSIRYDNTELIEAPFPHDSHHFFSRSLDLIVGDGSHTTFPYILLWRYIDGAFDGPRVVCRHRSSTHIQRTHVHPRFSPDGKYIVYTSDDKGYGNVYTVDVPDFESLPELSQVMKGK